MEDSIDHKFSSATSDSKAGYKSVFKATSIFGGVQVFNIAISLIRGKVLAVLIGTTGMGLNGLLMSSLTMLQKASGLGLSESAVRDISLANSSNDLTRLTHTYTVFSRWIWVSAAIGFILTIALSPLLSKIAFGDNVHTISFIMLSVTFIFGALTGGTYTLLRGMRKIKDLAKANIVGAVAGFLVSLPIFYFFRIDGVVPAIIATSVITYLVSIYFRKKVSLRIAAISLRDSFMDGKQMVSLGVILTVSSLLTAGVRFVINAYITKSGGLADLGIYNAGSSIMSGYVGIVFTAMGTDYYPRLSGLMESGTEWKDVVNQQAEIVVLILGPILTLILLSAPILIRLLLSSEFLPATGFIVWATLSVLLRGIAWVSSFVIIAKGDNKLFLYTELAAQVWFLSLSFMFYKFMGTDGLGISLTLGYLLSAIMLFFVLKKQYGFSLSKAAYRLVFFYLALLITSIASIKIFEYPEAYLFTGIIFMLSLLISIKGLNSRMDLTMLLKTYYYSIFKYNR